MYKGWKLVLQMSTDKKDLPDAFIVSSDMISLGIIRGLHECNCQIPGDFALVSFDDIEMAAFSRPALTTIRQDRRELGYRLWQMTREVNAGKSYIQPSVASILVEDTNPDGEMNREQMKVNLLTKREYEVLILIAEGLNNKGIADASVYSILAREYFAR